jgi:ABC-2 type transport system ATP-binding protein
LTDYAIELEQVSKSFGKQLAVDSLDLKVPEGSIYGFIGPNGSGKTTTLRMILRIFHPDRGVVKVLGNQAGKTADNRLGYLPEERGLYKRMKVVDVLRYYAELKGFYRCRQEIARWLEKMGASAWGHKRIESLSKGMAQKIQFISAVIAQPRLLILDEPFSGLDPVNLQAIKEAIIELKNQGTTILFSTHDMEMAEKMCNTIFMIFNGKKVLDGTLDSIQATYPANRIRLRLEGRQEIPALRGVLSTSPLLNGPYTELMLQSGADSQALLRELVQQRTVTHFEVVRPSLHDIFVSIASPPLGD